MNQSDIRGLAFQPEPTGIFFVASFAFYGREFSSSKTNLSHRTHASSFVVPTLLSIITPEYLFLIKITSFLTKTWLWLGGVEKNKNSSPKATPYSFAP
jgi:hypothetical protein